MWPPFPASSARPPRFTNLPHGGRRAGNDAARVLGSARLL